MRPTLAFALAALFLVPTPARAQALQLVGFSPAPNAVGVPRDAAVHVLFDGALDEASVTAATVRVLGRWSGPVPGALALGDDGRRITFTPSRPFAAGELVTLQISRGVRTLAGEGLAAGLGLQFWAAAAPGSLDVAEVGQVEIRREGEGPIITYGGHSGHFDGDGLLDFIVTNEASDDARLFLNDGAGGYGAFTVIPLPGGSVPSPLESGDFNADGHTDIAIANTGNDQVSVLLGDGEGGFPDAAAYDAGQAVRAIAALDLDGDGVDELVTGNFSANSVTVLPGRADGTFDAPATVAMGSVDPHALAVADFDGDGLLDVVVGNYSPAQLILLRNDGAGGLVEADRIALGGPAWMVATGDVDGDGAADVAVASSGGNRVEVGFGDGAGAFERVEQWTSGQFVIAIDLGDLDGDGDLDVVSSSYGSRDFRIYENPGDGALGNVRRLPTAGAGSCMTLHDRDDDGDLDATGIDEVVDRIYLYENVGLVTNEPAASPPVLALTLDGPNPVRARATLRLTLPAAGDARLRLFDALGRTVATLHDGPLAAGAHAAPFDAGALAPGAYVARLDAAGASVAVRLVVAR